jgi:hypothetical protein
MNGVSAVTVQSKEKGFGHAWPWFTKKNKAPPRSAPLSANIASSMTARKQMDDDEREKWKGELLTCREELRQTELKHQHLKAELLTKLDTAQSLRVQDHERHCQREGCLLNELAQAQQAGCLVDVVKQDVANLRQREAELSSQLQDALQRLQSDEEARQEAVNRNIQRLVMEPAPACVNVADSEKWNDISESELQSDTIRGLIRKLAANEELIMQLSFGLEQEHEQGIKLRKAAAEQKKELEETLTFSEEWWEERVKSERDRNHLLSSELERERGERIKYQTESEEQKKEIESVWMFYDSESQRNTQLSSQLQQEQYQKIALQKQLLELQRQQHSGTWAEMERMNEIARKQHQIQSTVGCPVIVRRVGIFGEFMDDDLNYLTQAMLTQLKAIKDSFSKAFPVLRIEYIMNDRLYKQFKDTRATFRRLGRNSQEVLLFHGTFASNINSYVQKGKSDLGS